MATNVQMAKIPNQSVANDCAQVLIPYFTSMTIFDCSDVLFYAPNEKEIKINNYIEDDRRIQFPYHEVPVHCEKGCFYTNQICDFGKTYLLIRPDDVQQYGIFNTDDGAVLCVKSLGIVNYNSKFIKLEDIHSLLRELVNLSEGQTYLLSSEGHFIRLASEEERMQELGKYLDYLDEYNICYKCANGIFTHSVMTEKVCDTMIPLGLPIYIVNINGENISVKSVKINEINTDCYKFSTYDLPMHEFNFEEMSSLTNNSLKTLKKPSIPRRYKKNKN